MRIKKFSRLIALCTFILSISTSQATEPISLLDSVVESGSLEQIVRTVNQRYAAGNVTETETMRWRKIFKDRILQMPPARQEHEAPLLWTELVEKIHWTLGDEYKIFLENLKFYPDRGEYGFVSSVVIWSLKRKEDVNLADLDLISLIENDVSDRRGWRQSWHLLADGYPQSYKLDELDKVYEEWLRAIQEARKSSADADYIASRVITSLDILDVGHDLETQDMIREELAENIRKNCESLLVKK